MSEIVPLHGHLYRVVIEPETAMLCLVVSANAFNTRHHACITVLVSADRNVPAGLPSWVRLSAGDPAFGHVVCSDVGMVAREELKEDLGPLSAETLMRVSTALRQAIP